MWFDSDEEQYDNEGISIDILRARLEDYYGTAMQQFSAAIMDLVQVRNMSDEEVVREAQKAGLI